MLCVVQCFLMWGLLAHYAGRSEHAFSIQPWFPGVQLWFACLTIWSAVSAECSSAASSAHCAASSEHCAESNAFACRLNSSFTAGMVGTTHPLKCGATRRLDELSKAAVHGSAVEPRAGSALPVVLLLPPALVLKQNQMHASAVVLAAVADVAWHCAACSESAAPFVGGVKAWGIPIVRHTHPPCTYVGAKYEHTLRSSFVHAAPLMQSMHRG